MRIGTSVKFPSVPCRPVLPHLMNEHVIRRFPRNYVLGAGCLPHLCGLRILNRPMLENRTPGAGGSARSAMPDPVCERTKPQKPVASQQLHTFAAPIPIGRTGASRRRELKHLRADGPAPTFHAHGSAPRCVRPNHVPEQHTGR